MTNSLLTETLKLLHFCAQQGNFYMKLSHTALKPNSYKFIYVLEINQKKQLYKDLLRAHSHWTYSTKHSNQTQ